MEAVAIESQSGGIFLLSAALRPIDVAETLAKRKVKVRGPAHLHPRGWARREGSISSNEVLYYLKSRQEIAYPIFDRRAATRRGIAGGNSLR
jgi:hypothetical protein